MMLKPSQRLSLQHLRPAAPGLRLAPCVRTRLASDSTAGGRSFSSRHRIDRWTYGVGSSECRASPSSTQSGREEEEEEDVEEGAEEELEQLSEARHVITVDSFLKQARQLRAVFDERFKEPRSNSPERFMWDYWHVPDQYTLVRTQAQVYFSPELYDALEDALIEYGEKHLGCRAITPIWMSYYVEGCVQELHCDNPHGPFAFVLSLTEWDQRKFRGGETAILRPQVLDYWSSLYSSRQGLEQKHLVQLVEPRFNRLTVFDPRFPHGVKMVTGTKDPREARLVLHGGLSEQEAQPALDEAMGEAMMILEDLPPVTGLLTMRITVSGEDGTVTDVQWLADTLVPLPAGPDLPPDQVRAGCQHVLRSALLQSARFPPSKDGSPTTITLPVVFD